jgi:hypothetical protein
MIQLPVGQAQELVWGWSPRSLFCEIRAPKRIIRRFHVPDVNPPAHGPDQIRSRCGPGGNVVVGIASVHPVPLCLAFQSRRAGAVGFTIGPWTIAAARVDHDPWRFGTNVKLVTVSQTGNANAGMYVNTLDLFGYGLFPSQSVLTDPAQKERRSD